MTVENTRLKPDITRAERAVAQMAAAFPETREDNPWGHRAFKVRGKTFLFLSTDGGSLNLSVKLPSSGVLALSLPFTEPTHYGLGKSGWVSAQFESGQHVPLDMIGEWLGESYAAIAPKKLSAVLNVGPGTRLSAPPAAKAKTRTKTKTKTKTNAASKTKAATVRQTQTAKPAKASRPRRKTRPARR
jgi:predicted DNA-binding protein (MmcQ/YjbR family)